MVAISFSVWGYEFESGILAIERMYVTAVEALSMQTRNCRARRLEIGRGEKKYSAGSRNELYSNEVLIEHELAGIEESMQLLRQSTVLMAYHFWEKQILRWAQLTLDNTKTVSNHEAYIAFCIEQRFDVDVANLETLHLIANVVKHGQGQRSWVDRLWNHLPSLFSDDTANSSNPSELLKLSHGMVFELRSAIQASGPRSFGSFNPAS